MTDKEIIIDGVDISKCKHYLEVFNYCDQSYLGEGGLLKNTKNPKRCECSPNCYYKQLKRKEQEVQQAMDNYVQLDLQRVKEYNELFDLYKTKEQECEKLYIQLKADEEYHKEKETIEKLLNVILSSIEDASSEIDNLKDKIDLYDDLCDFLLDLSCREDCPEDVTKQASDLYMRI